MPGKRFFRQIVPLLLFIFFTASYITAGHIHKQNDQDNLHHHCDVCILTHHFIAADITPDFHEASILSTTTETIPYPNITYRYRYRKYINTQAPPVFS